MAGKLKVAHRLCISFIGLTLVTSAFAADITIGAIFSLSGPNASYGDIFGSGANLARDHINEDNLLNGKLNIQYEDSQGLPQPGVVAMNKLVNVTKVPYVLSAFTGVSKAISTSAARSKTVAVNGGGVGSDLAGLGPYFWNVIPLATDEVKAILPYLVEEKKLKRMILVYVDDPLGAGIREELENSLPEVGGELVDSLSVPANMQQFSGVAARVRAAKPDVIYIASYGSQQNQMIKQFRDNGIKQQIASYSAFSIPETNALPEAKGSLYTTQSIDWSSVDPITKRFVDGYREKYKKLPSAYIANYYNAVRLFGILAGELIKQGKPITGENLLQQRKDAKSFDLVGGRVTFTDKGTVVSPMQILEIDGEGGKIVSKTGQDAK